MAAFRGPLGGPPIRLWQGLMMSRLGCFRLVRLNPTKNRDRANDGKDSWRHYVLAATASLFQGPSLGLFIAPAGVLMRLSYGSQALISPCPLLSRRLRHRPTILPQMAHWGPERNVRLPHGPKMMAFSLFSHVLASAFLEMSSRAYGIEWLWLNKKEAKGQDPTMVVLRM